MHNHVIFPTISTVGLKNLGYITLFFYTSPKRSDNNKTQKMVQVVKYFSLLSTMLRYVKYFYTAPKKLR